MLRIQVGQELLLGRERPLAHVTYGNLAIARLRLCSLI